MENGKPKADTLDNYSPSYADSLTKKNGRVEVVRFKTGANSAGVLDVLVYEPVEVLW
jgi:hypothetical protein